MVANCCNPSSTVWAKAAQARRKAGEGHTLELVEQDMPIGWVGLVCLACILPIGALLASSYKSLGRLEAAVKARYAGWDRPENQAILASDLATVAKGALSRGLNPRPRSGRQERLENIWNRFV